MYGNDFDIMIEAKAKELAVKRYNELHIKNNNKGIYIGLKRPKMESKNILHQRY
jgi:hypothetical protein